MRIFALFSLCVSILATAAPAQAQWGTIRVDSVAVQGAVDLGMPGPLQLSLSDRDVMIREGQRMEVTLTASGGNDSTYTFSLVTGPDEAELDSFGRFSWTPPFDFVAGRQRMREVQAVVSVRDADGSTDVQPIRIAVQHVNRPPEATAPLLVSVKPETAASFELPVRDEDGDALTFSVQSILPSGARLSREGVFTWTPSNTQYQSLPLNVEFSANDGTASLRDQFRVMKWDGGLAPTITLIRGSRSVREGEPIVFEVKASDPDGFENIEAYGVSNLPTGSDWKRDGSVGTFTWTPDYSTVSFGNELRPVELSFFVRDIDGMEDRETVTFEIFDAPDPDELFRQYRMTLASATSTIDQLIEQRRSLMEKRTRADNRRKIRSVAKIIFGSSTAIFGLLTDQSIQRWGTAMSGVATATLAGLETANVFKSPTDYDRDIDGLTTALVSLQTEAEMFARNYNSPDKRGVSKFGSDSEMITSVIKGVRAKYETVESTLVEDEDIKRVTIYYTTN